MCRDLPEGRNEHGLFKITRPLFVLMGKGLLHASLNLAFEASFYQSSHFFFSLIIYLSGIPSIITETCTIGFVLRTDTNSLGTCIALTSISHFL